MKETRKKKGKELERNFGRIGKETRLELGKILWKKPRKKLSERIWQKLKSNDIIKPIPSWIGNYKSIIGFKEPATKINPSPLADL